MRKITKCRTCWASIFWCFTPAGKRMPLDADPVPSGNVSIVNGEAVVNAKDDEGPKYLSHFATCPQAGQHRR